MIVVQVALTVVFPAVVWFENVQLGRMQDFNPGFATNQFLTVQVERDATVDSDVTPDAATVERDTRMAATLGELRARVALPGVTGVTFAETVPGGEYQERSIELGYDAAEKAARGPEAPVPFRYGTVAETDTSYFDVLDAPILAGRAFNAADAEPGARVAIVDQSFVENVLQGRNPIGQQVRFVRPGNPDGPERVVFGRGAGRQA